MELELDAILKTFFGQIPEESSLKELLLAMPDIGEDADFCRILDSGRQIVL